MAAISSKGFAALLEPQFEKLYNQVYDNASMIFSQPMIFKEPDDMQSLYDLLDENSERGAQHG